MSRKKYRYKKETAQNDGVTVIDENNDNVPEALEIDGHREDFVEVKELDETEPRPKGYEEITEEETASRVEGDTASTGDTHTTEDTHYNTEEATHSDVVAQPTTDADTHVSTSTDVHADTSAETHTETHENPQGADSHETSHTTDDQAGAHMEGNTDGVDARPNSEEVRREENTVGLHPTQPEGAVAGSTTEGGQPSTGVVQPAPETHTETTHAADPLVPDVRPPAQPLEPDIRPAPSQDGHDVESTSSETASSAQEPPAAVSPESGVSQPQPPVGASEDHHDTVVSPASPNGEGVTSSEQQPPSAPAGTHEENHVSTQPTGEVSTPAPVEGTPAGQTDPTTASPSATVGTEPAVSGSTGNTETHEEVMRPYTPPAVEQPANQVGSEAPAVTPSAPSDTVTVESATGPAPGEVTVPEGSHGGGVGAVGEPDTSHVEKPIENHELSNLPDLSPETLGKLLPEEMHVVQFAQSIRNRMTEYCRLMGPGQIQTQQSLVRNQLELYSIFMAVLYVSDVQKFEAGIKQIFVVMQANKARCFDYSSRFRGIMDIPSSRMKDDEAEVFTSLIDLFCRLVETDNLYDVGRTYNFSTLQRHLTDQFVLSRFLGFIRRLVGAA